MNNYERIMRWSVRRGSLLLVFAILTSIVIQDYTHALPLGLFNTGRQPYTQLANACLIMTFAIFMTLMAEAWRDGQWRLTAAVRGGLDALRGHSDMYRRGDTHLSDLGNKIAGEYVGEKLVRLLATTGLGRP